MTSRLARRKRFVIAGCIFAAVISGIACTGVAHASGCTISVSATGDGPSVSSGEWSWEASDGTLPGILPAGAGQEVIRGGYSSAGVSSGPLSVRASRSLESGDTPNFSTSQEIHAPGPCFYEESISIDSCGLPGGGVSCAASGNTSDLNRSAYCEHAGVSVMLMTGGLGYISTGTVAQGAIEHPDSLSFLSSAEGSGSGSIAAAAGSMNGIGTDMALGYRERVREEISVSGQIHLDSIIEWSSLNNSGIVS
ncbi:MAG TPA: hypothetical protein VMC42_05675 [Methanoregulaceae archaeon]|nr:hypothetical protein [Methanoregulaceae archaeon]